MRLSTAASTHPAAGIALREALQASSSILAVTPFTSQAPPPQRHWRHECLDRTHGVAVHSYPRLATAARFANRCSGAVTRSGIDCLMISDKIGLAE